MTPERWRHVQSIFLEAADLPPGRQRDEFLADACGVDAGLRREVEALLAADADPPPVLAASIDELAELVLDDLPFEPAMPQRVGPYRIVREIGRGGMGTVYLAERDDGQFEQRVALKLIRRDDDHVMQRFLSERQILASLQHPNIARLYDGGRTDDGRPYLVMEYVNGKPIDVYCDERRLPIDERLRLFIEVAEVVQFAHQNLIVHRDLKPGNILIGVNGDVKLLDFGIAKLLENGEPAGVPITQTGMRVMTPEYAAPEQVLGRPVTTATDVYALGLVLYELLTGRRPYSVSKESSADAERTITQEQPERPSTAVARTVQRRSADGTTESISPEILSEARGTSVERLRRRLHGDLDRILLMALRKEPERRYASAEAFLDDIRRHLSGLPVRARPDTLAYRARKFVTRHAIPVAAAVLVIASLVAGLGAALYQAEQARRERDTAEEVSTFLEELFTAADPFEASQTERLDTLRIRDFLERGTRRVQRDLTGQPGVQARLLATLGRVHHQLGLYDEARPLLEEAVDLHRDVEGEGHPETLRSLERLASVRASMGEYHRADSLYRVVIDGYRRAFGNEHERTTSALNNLALVLKAQGRFDEAEAIHREALETNRRILGENDPEIAININMLAALLMERGELEDAEQLFRESLEMRRSHYGDRHPSIAIALNNLASIMRDTGRYAEAEPLIREALAINRQVFGSEHPHIADNLSLLGSILRNLGKLEDAETTLLQAVEMDRKLYGERHPSVSVALDTYASLLRQQGKLDDAERTQREATSIARDGYGADHYVVGITTSRLAGILYEKGEVARAEALYREAHDIMRKHFDEDHINVVSMDVYRAQCLIDLGRSAEAEALLVQSFDRLSSRQGLENRFVRQLAGRLARFYEENSRAEEAARYRAISSQEPES